MQLRIPALANCLLSTGTPSAATTDAEPDLKLVSTKELLALANAILSCTDPLVTVPTEIIRAGLRAVSARKRSATYFISKTKKEDAEMVQANEGHSHFFSVMEEVIMALQPRFAVSAGANAANTPLAPSTIDDLENCFAALEVEEPSEESVSESKLVPQEVLVQPMYDVEPPESRREIEKEKLFAFFCLFNDLQHLRSFVRTLWIEFGLGVIDLITASVTTNAAFQLAIRTQDEILVAYPECGDYQSTHTYTFFPTSFFPLC